MYLPDDSILIESRSARDKQMAEMPDDLAQDILNRAKALVFAVWQGQGTATSRQMAEFYEVPVDAIESRRRTYSDELESDGLRTLKGLQLKDFKQLSALKAESSNAASLIVWTPRAALRLGMFLRDSPVAKQVRNLLIEMAAQGGGRSSNERELMLQIELQKLRQQHQNSLQQYQDTGLQIVDAYGPGMLSFIRGEKPLIRTEIQYIDRRTGNPLGVTTSFRILPQLVEEVALQRNSEEDQQRVKDILKRELGVDWGTGEGLGEGFMIARPLVIPEDRYWEYVRVVAVDLYGERTLAGWNQEQQFLSDYLKDKGILPPGK